MRHEISRSHSNAKFRAGASTTKAINFSTVARGGIRL